MYSAWHVTKSDHENEWIMNQKKVTKQWQLVYKIKGEATPSIYAD